MRSLALSAALRHQLVSDELDKWRSRKVRMVRHKTPMARCGSGVVRLSNTRVLNWQGGSVVGGWDAAAGAALLWQGDDMAAAGGQEVARQGGERTGWQARKEERLSGDRVTGAKVAE